MRTFRCEFSNGVACEVKASDRPPPKGEGHIRRVEWRGVPSMAIVRDYIAWMNSVNETLANEWGIKIMHIFQTGPGMLEIWSYSPGQAPERLGDPMCLKTKARGV